MTALSFLLLIGIKAIYYGSLGHSHSEKVEITALTPCLLTKNVVRY